MGPATRISYNMRTHRLPTGIAMGAVCAVEFGMLSLPLVPLFLSPKAPKDEFYGLAMLGEAFIIGGVAALLGFATGLAGVLKYYRLETARRIKHVFAAVAIALGVALAAIAAFEKSNEGLFWAVACSATALAIGLVKAFNTPIATD